MKNVVFVILNYNTAFETMNCIDSIEEIEHYDFFVRYIVVDNHSDDDSMEIFEKRYKNNRSIEYVRMAENAGFSKANNAGYMLAVEKYDPEFVIVVNSDILIYQKDFLGKIEQIYKEEKFFVLGPDIYVPSLLCHQSPPIREYSPSIDALELEVKRMKREMARIEKNKKRGKNAVRKYVRSKNIVRNILKNLYCILFKKGYRIKGYNVHLHGAALIFSKDFCTAHPQKCFFPEVYFYGEEDILQYQCQKRKERMLYSPQLQVLHLKSVATYRRWGGRYDVEKILVTTKYRMDSKRMLIKLMREDMR